MHTTLTFESKIEGTWQHQLHTRPPPTLTYTYTWAQARAQTTRQVAARTHLVQDGGVVDGVAPHGREPLLVDPPLGGDAGDESPVDEVGRGKISAGDRLTTAFPQTQYVQGNRLNQKVGISFLTLLMIFDLNFDVNLFLFYQYFSFNL